LKVLVSAYACEPGKGSEPEVGWQWVHQIARFHETWVISRANNREAIEKALTKSPINNLHFVYVDLPEWARFWKKGRSGVHLYYYLWQFIAYRKARNISKNKRFDIVHHITFINMYMGPLLALLDVPFIWGPIGANPYIPMPFCKSLGFLGLRDNMLRLAIRKISPLLDPFIYHGQRKAKQILVINAEIKSRLKQNIQNKCVTIPQNAIDKTLLSKAPKTFHRPLNILSVGQLVSIKGFRYSLAAFKKHLSSNAESRLTIIGDGSQRHELLQYATELNISDKVFFAGKMNRATVLMEMEKCDVFLFPSFEGAGMVVIEALAKGLPVVCLDFGGPGEYVTEDCGIKVPLSEPEKVTTELSNALSTLASDKTLYERLSVGAIERVKENYLWDRVGDKLNSIYQEIFKDTKDKAHSK